MLSRGALAALILALAACGSSGDEAALPCPAAVTVGDAARLTRFIGGGTDLTEVDFELEIEELVYSCSYESGDAVVDMSVVVSMIGTKGPANTTGLADYSYFVAVANAQREILAREDFEVSMPFQGTLTRVRLVEELTPRIPLNPGETGASYRVFVGIDLTPAELEYNRTH